MVFKYKMTAEEYYIGYKYKLKKGKLPDTMLISTVIMAAVMFLLAMEFELGMFYAVFLAVIPVIMLFAEIAVKKKTVLRNYNMLPQLNSQQSIHLCEDGIKLYNSFEKVYVKWERIFAVKETPKYLIIIFSFRNGIAVIDKEKWQSEQLNEIIDALHDNTFVEEGKK